MDVRSQNLVEVLEKLASPLVGAVAEVSTRIQLMPEPTDPSRQRSEAQQIAGLLTKTTQMSIGLSELADLKLADRDADHFRLSLTALAAPLVANMYRLSGRAPLEGDIERLQAAMAAVITFKDNFDGAAESTARLNALDKDFFPADAHQVTMQYMNILLPVVNSIMAYSFGQPEKKLIQDVTERLIAESKKLREKLFAKLDGVEALRAQMALLRMCTLIYSQCHFGEMAKLMATEEQARQGLAPAMNTLWAAFDIRVQMLEVLSMAIVPGAGSAAATSSSGGGKKPSPLKAEKPASTAPPASPPPQAAQENAQKANPMSFFAKKSG
jgi:hypothetical protein